MPGVIPSPARQAVLGGKNYKCAEFLNWVVTQISNVPPEVPVVLVSRYAELALGGNEKRLERDAPEGYFSKLEKYSTLESLNEFGKHITQAACQLAEQRTVYMMRPIPEMGFNVPKLLSRRMILKMNEDLSIPLEDYRRRNSWVWTAQDAARDQCGIKILDPLPYLCRDDRCYGSQNGRPLYIDDDHLSEFGNKLLIPMFTEVF